MYNTSEWREVVAVDRFYTALFSALEHTHCALVACDPEFKFSVASRPQRLYGLLGTSSPGRPRLSTKFITS